MKDLWKDFDARQFIKTHGPAENEELAVLAYATRLVGAIPDLAMHGGGNTSCKGIFRTASKDQIRALFIKPSGADMKTVFPEDFIALDLLSLMKSLRSVRAHGDEEITAMFRQHMLKPSNTLPSIETPMHALLENRFVIHTHPSAILALSNRIGGEKIVTDALGAEAGFIPYASLGLDLGGAVATEMKKKGLQAIVLSQHGLVTWGESAKEAYKKTIGLVSRAESHLKRTKGLSAIPESKTSVNTAMRRYKKYAPLLTELLSPYSSVLSPLISKEILDAVDGPKAREIFCTEPLNPDHLLRIKISPLFIENPDYENEDILRRQIVEGLKSFRAGYAAYLKRHAKRLHGLMPDDSEFMPRVLLMPGLGAVCAAADMQTADILRDITRQAFHVKRLIYETGGDYLGLSEDDSFEMELRRWRKQKLHPMQL